MKNSHKCKERLNSKIKARIFSLLTLSWFSFYQPPFSFIIIYKTRMIFYFDRKRINHLCVHRFWHSSSLQSSGGENNIGAPKMQKNFSFIKLLIFILLLVKIYFFFFFAFFGVFSLLIFLLFFAPRGNSNQIFL